jgi:cold shock CspA family protein
MGRGAGEIADFYCDPDNLGTALAHGVLPPWMDGMDEVDRRMMLQAFGGGASDDDDGPAGQDRPTWTAVVQGKFRVQQRGGADLFTSDGFHQHVRRHQEAERANPRRSIREKWTTLVYPSMGDKCEVWWTDEQGIEQRTEDLIECQPPQHWEDLLLDDYGGQMAEDIFWTAAILWKHFGTSGDSKYDQAFARKLKEVRKAGQAAAQPAAAAAVATAADSSTMTTATTVRLREGCAASGAQSRWPLNESDLDCKADVHGWEKLDTVASQAPMASYSRAGVRLNFWLSTGTVGSYLDHPRQGKSQLFRREITMNAADALFENPRQHTGVGYHRRGGMCDTRGDGTVTHTVTGTAARWNDARGFGFIKPDRGGDDVFCHFSVIQGGTRLREGMQVEYIVEWDDQRRKHRATQVAGAAVEDGEDRRGQYGHGAIGTGGERRVGGYYGSSSGGGGHRYDPRH